LLIILLVSRLSVCYTSINPQVVETVDTIRLTSESISHMLDIAKKEKTFSSYVSAYKPGGGGTYDPINLGRYQRSSANHLQRCNRQFPAVVLVEETVQHLVVVVGVGEPHLEEGVGHTQKKPRELRQGLRQSLQEHHQQQPVEPHSIGSTPCKQHNRHKPHKGLDHHSIAHTALRNQLQLLDWQLPVLEQVLPMLA
jgi:hypothetical protein